MEVTRASGYPNLTSMQLQNKTALVTGGTKGIGYGIAAALLNMKMRVAITSRSDQTAGSAMAKLRKIGQGEVLALTADVRDIKAQQRCVDTVLEKWGQLDVLVANAGIGHFGSIETLTPDDWHETIDTNLTGVFYSVKASLDALKKSKGYIITIGSLAGANFFAGGSAYNASKFGLLGFTQALMLDVRNHGVRVTTIMPGSVDTQFSNNDSGQGGWKIQPEDIGKLVVDLLTMHPRTLPSKIEVRPSIPGK